MKGKITYREGNEIKLIDSALNLSREELIRHINQLEGRLYPEMQFHKSQIVYSVEPVNYGSVNSLYQAFEDRIYRVSFRADGTPRYYLGRSHITVGNEDLYKTMDEAKAVANKLNAIHEYKESIYSAYENCTIQPQTEFKNDEYKRAYESAIKYILSKNWRLDLYTYFVRDAEQLLTRVKEVGDVLIQEKDGRNNRFEIMSLARNIRGYEKAVLVYNSEAKKHNHLVTALNLTEETVVPEELKLNEVLVAYAAKFEELQLESLESIKSAIK